MITVYNLPKGVKEGRVKKVINNVLQGERREGKGAWASLSAVFLEEKEIQKLNLRYRGINRPTDVLSFSADEKGYLGEVLVCENQVRKNAKTAKEPFDKELARVLIHGTLHLLGHEHEKSAGAARIILGKQEDYLKL